MKRKIYTLIIFAAFTAWFASARAQDSIPITYQVDMSTAVLGAGGGTCPTPAFDPATDVVEAMGQEYNNWTAPENVACGTAFTPSADVDFVPIATGSSVYTKTKTVLPSATGTLTYKFRIDHSWDNDELRGIGDGNRHVTVPAGATAIVIASVFNDSSNTVTVTGINDPKLGQIQAVYPNPASNSAILTYSIASSNNDQVSIFITNAIGQIIENDLGVQKSFGAHQITLNTSDLATGMYYVNLKVGNSVVSEKLTIVR